MQGVRAHARHQAVVPVAAALGLVLGACSPQASPASSAPAAQGVSGPFTLALFVPRTAWAANGPIDLAATLVYSGDAPSIKLTGSGSGLIGFNLTELTGRREVRGVQTADCRGYQLDRNVPVRTPYIKSGGLIGNEPDVDWIRQFLEDPVFRLPVGRWRVTAFANFTEGSCGPNAVSRQIRASVDLTVA